MATGSLDTTTLCRLVDAITDPALVTDPDGRIFCVNAAFEVETGYRAHEVRGYRPGDLLRCAATDPADAAAIDRAIAEHLPVRRTIDLKDRTGRHYAAEVAMRPIRDDEGGVEALLFVERDITAMQEAQTRRARADAEAARWRSQLAVAIETIPDGFVVFDPEDRLVVCNRRYREIYGNEAEYMAGMRFEDLLRRDVALGKFAEAAGREEAWVQERLAAHRDPGEPLTQRLHDGTRLRIIERRTPDGGLVGLRQDVTGLVEARERAERAERLLREAIEAMPAAITIYDADDRLLACNRHCDEIYPADAPVLREGMSFEEILRNGLKAGQYPWVTDEEAFIAWATAPAREGRTFWEHLYRNGNGKWIRSLNHRTADGGWVGFRLDVSELVEARERAEAADAAKSRFLANMSHEIRTPLTAIMGHAELLRHEADPARISEHARALVEAGALLLSLVDDALDLSKIEAGRMTLKRSPFSPTALIESVGRLHRARAEERGLSLIVACDPSAHAQFLGDERRLAQVLGNLVGNAVAYTDQGGVGLTATTYAGRLVFEVADTGAGMTSEDLARAFEPFATGSLGRERSGTGLGLAIARDLVALMDGTITAERRGNGGTLVRVTVPLERVVLPRPPVASEPAAGPAVPAGLRVLVVDDVATNRLIFDNLCRHLGAAPTVAASGEAAVAAAERAAFDLYLIDLSMPGMDGTATLKALREVETRLARAPARAVAATAYAIDQEASVMLSAGFDAHLAKPVSLDSLRRCLAASPRPSPGQARAQDAS